MTEGGKFIGNVVVEEVNGWLVAEKKAKTVVDEARSFTFRE